MISPVIVVSVFYLNMGSILLGLKLATKKNANLIFVRLVLGIFLLTLIYLTAVGIHGLNFYEPENKDFTGFWVVWFLYFYYPQFLIVWSIFLVLLFFVLEHIDILIQKKIKNLNRHPP
tara:strand:+ start:202 stop:555 length:354 start_codon:yes stop_codon:yes gene_type:complete